MNRKLTRNTSNSVLGGVCSGIAQYLDLDPTVVRILTVLATVLGFGSLVLVYLVMWILVPADRAR